MDELHTGDIVRVSDSLGTYDCYGCLVKRYEPSAIDRFRCNQLPVYDRDYKVISVHPHEKWAQIQLAIIEDCCAPFEVFVVNVKALNKQHVDMVI